MTAPKITYVQGFHDDCSSTADWNETESGLDATLSCLYDDILQIEGTCDSSANEYVTYEKDINNISTTTYPQYAVRWKTSEASNGLQAQIWFSYTDASWESITLGYSTAWKTSTGTLTTGKTLDKIVIIANDYPNTIDSGTYQVWFDFIIVCQGIFQFPFFESVEMNWENLYAFLSPIRRVGNITQYMGAESPTITVTGTMDSNTSWQDTNGKPGDFLYYVFHRASDDLFQWFESDVINCKVVPVRFKIGQYHDIDDIRRYEAVFRFYTVADLNEDTFGTFEWYQ